jgi:hypothetical protein
MSTCSRLTNQNIRAIIRSSDSGFACAAPRLAGRPDWVTVPLRNVVYYDHYRKLEHGQESCDAQYGSTCVLRVKQVPVQDTVSRDFPCATVPGKTGEEALPPSGPYCGMDCLPGFETGQPLIK